MTKEEITNIVHQTIAEFIDCNDEKLTDKDELLLSVNKAICKNIKALEQPGDDVMAIHTQGLDEGIRCAMCTNSMKSDRGCDGGCYNIVQTIHDLEGRCTVKIEISEFYGWDEEE